MYLSYAVTLALKASIPVLSPAIISDPLVAMTKTQFGVIMAYGGLGGLFGKFIFGWSSDKYGGKISFLIGLLLLSLSVTAFGLTHQYLLFIVTFFSISLTKSAGWPSMTKLIGHWYPPSQFGRVWGVISTSSRTGAILASLSVGALLYILNWQKIMWCASILGGLTTLLWFFYAKERPPMEQEVNQEEPTYPTRDAEHPLSDMSLKAALIVFSKSKRVWLIFIGMMGLSALMDFLNFIPLFLLETLHVSSAQAAMMAGAFPAGSLIAVLVGGFLFDALSPRNVTRLIGAFLGVAVLSLLAILNLSHLGLTAETNTIVIFVCLFSFGFSISPAYYLPMSIFSIKFGGPHSGALVSILDIGGYIGGMFFALVTGILADQVLGWNKVLLLLIGISIVTLFVVVSFLHGESKAAHAFRG